MHSLDSVLVGIGNGKVSVDSGSYFREFGNLGFKIVFRLHVEIGRHEHTSNTGSSTSTVTYYY